MDKLTISQELDIYIVGYIKEPTEENKRAMESKREEMYRVLEV